MNRLSKIFCIFGAVALGFTTAVAADAVKDRRAVMKKEIAANFGMSRKMAKGTIPFDKDKARQAMMTISAAADKFVKMFPKGTEVGKAPDSEAKPEIWSDMKGFLAKADDLKKVTANVANAALQGQAVFAKAVGDIGKACGSCHKVYRQKSKK